MAKTPSSKTAKPSKTAKSAKGSKAAAPAASPAPGSSGPAVDIGIKDKDRRKISRELSRLLADSFSLYLKTHNFHWNVTGPMFNSLHAMFEEQYTEQWQALDEIA